MTQRYDNNSACTSLNYCYMNFEVTSEMKGPVYVYYEITNFYQNHRKYFKSKSPEQLRGNKIDNSQAESDCEPVVYNRDLWTNKSYNGIDLPPNEVAYPCGSMARSFFNDTYIIERLDDSGVATSSLTISSEGIAWPQDKKYKYNPPPPGVVAWLDVMDERFMVWMRASATPTFRKLWGRIDSGLSVGKYRYGIMSNWPTSGFGGEKRIVISQTNSFGGKNIFLASCYIVIGGLCLIAAIVFLVRKLVRSKGILEAKLE